MRQAGIDDYRAFALQVLQIVSDRPVSFEVFSGDIAGMEAQAHGINSWGRNVNVKIPITNTKVETTAPLVGRLSAQGVVCNVTAMFTLGQLQEIVQVLDPATAAILSVFSVRMRTLVLIQYPTCAPQLQSPKPNPERSCSGQARVNSLTYFKPKKWAATSLPLHMMSLISCLALARISPPSRWRLLQCFIRTHKLLGTQLTLASRRSRTYKGYF